MIARPGFIILTLLFALAGTPGFAAPCPEGSGGRNDDAHLGKPYLVLVSLDGFRWDYPEKFDPPTINRMLQKGFRAERLIPVFPTLTFPNHYSVATGLYPEHHGLVGNNFHAPEFDSWYELRNRDAVSDGRFYDGTPIWVAAECQGMVSAAFFFVGTEADIHGTRPTHWRPYSKRVPGEERVDQVLSWLGEPPETRPHLITLYFEDVDDHSHWSGVGSGPARDSIQRVDAWLQRLMQGIEALPHGDQVNVVVVSDHGQRGYVDDPEPLVISEHIALSGIRVIGKGPYAFLYYEKEAQGRISSDQGRLQAAWARGRVLTPAETPATWQVGDNDRWPNLMLVADPGYMVVTDFEQIPGLVPGTHGWAPEAGEMHGILFGVGPAFIPGARTGPVEVVDIYPLMSSILGLTVTTALDSDPSALKGVLKK